MKPRVRERKYIQGNISVSKLENEAPGLLGKKSISASLRLIYIGVTSESRRQIFRSIATYHNVVICHISTCLCGYSLLIPTLAITPESPRPTSAAADPDGNPAANTLHHIVGNNPVGISQLHTSIFRRSYLSVDQEMSECQPEVGRHDTMLRSRANMAKSKLHPWFLAR